MSPRARMNPEPVRRRRSLEQVVSAAVRPTQIGTLVLVVGLMFGLIWFVSSSRPQLNSARNGADALRASERAMFSEQNALTNYVNSNDPGFITTYRAAAAAAAAANTQASKDFRDSGSVTVNNLFAQSWTKAQIWISGWANAVENGTWTRIADTNSNGVVSPAERGSFTAFGNKLFGNYVRTQDHVEQVAEDLITTTLHSQFDEDLYFNIGVGVLGLAGLISMRTGLRRIRNRVVAPMNHLVHEADRVSSGDYTAINPDTDTSVNEVAELMASLQHMTASLIAERDEADARAKELFERTQRQQRLIELSRDLSASLSLRAVVTSLSKALRIVANVETSEVWVQEWDGHLLTRYDLNDELDPETVRVGSGAVGRAARYAQVQPISRPINEFDDSVDADPEGLAIPLVIGGRVVGVVVARPKTGQMLDMEMVNALGLQAAAALQASVVHSETEEQSRRDPLTDLANRRQLTLDIFREVERSQRFEHPLAFVMLDLDNFKQLNDRYGHPRGDEVLQGIAALIVSEIRSVDTAYRYGGEELAILMRQATGDEAVAMAERIRALVSREFDWAREAPVSFSAGVAMLGGTVETARDLIAAADAALYAAKHAGRDRVMLQSVAKDRRAG